MLCTYNNSQGITVSAILFAISPILVPSQLPSCPLSQVPGAVLVPCRSCSTLGLLWEHLRDLSCQEEHWTWKFLEGSAWTEINKPSHEHTSSPGTEHTPRLPPRPFLFKYLRSQHFNSASNNSACNFSPHLFAAYKFYSRNQTWKYRLQSSRGKENIKFLI